MRLISKLEGLSNVYFKTSMKHVATVQSKGDATNALFYTIEVLNEAIGKGKMRTRAFLNPEITYDDSFAAALQKPSEWNFTFPYTVSALRYLLNNITYTVIFALRLLFG